MSTALACDYCGHVCKAPVTGPSLAQSNQTASTWGTAGVDDLDGSHTAENAAPHRTPAALPPLEVNDAFPFEHVFDQQARLAPAPDATETRAGENVTSVFPLNDRAEAEDRDAMSYEDLGDEPGSEDREIAEMLPPSSKGAAHMAPKAPAPAGKLGARQMAMMGALFAAGALIFTILSMRGSASPESAAAAPAAPVGGTTSPARPKAAASLPAVLPKWNVVTEGRWIGRDRRTVAFELKAVNRIHIWMRDVTPVLVVRCQAGQVDPFVFTQSAARMEAQDEDHTVRVAFDDGSETTERWPDSVEHDALFARDAATFTHQLAASRTLRFGFTPHNAEPAVARFEVAGLRDLLASAPRQCGKKN